MIHRTGTLIGVVGMLCMACMVLTACGSPSLPALTPESVSTPETVPVTPATPAVRTAPTLPPEWTKTFTPTATITPTATPTITATALLSEAEICASFTFDLEQVVDPIPADEGVNFTAGVMQRDAVITILTERQDETTETPPTQSSIPGGDLYLVNFGQGDTPGIYNWSASISTSAYTAICPKSGTVTVIAPPQTLTPEAIARPSLIDELLGVIIRRVREDILEPMLALTQTAAAPTPTPAIEITPDQ